MLLMMFFVRFISGCLAALCCSVSDPLRLYVGLISFWWMRLMLIEQFNIFFYLQFAVCVCVCVAAAAFAFAFVFAFAFMFMLVTFLVEG